MVYARAATTEKGHWRARLGAPVPRTNNTRQARVDGDVLEIDTLASVVSEKITTRQSLFVYLNSTRKIAGQVRCLAFIGSM